MKLPRTTDANLDCVFVKAQFAGNNPWLIVTDRMGLSYWQDLSWTSIKATKLSGAQLRARKEDSPSKRSSIPSSVSSKASPSPEPPWRRKTPKTLLPRPLMQVWSQTHLLWFRVFLTQSTIPRDWYPLWNTLFWCDTHATAKTWTIALFLRVKVWRYDESIKPPYNRDNVSRSMNRRYR